MRNLWNRVRATWRRLNRADDDLRMPEWELAPGEKQILRTARERELEYQTEFERLRNPPSGGVG